MPPKQNRAFVTFGSPAAARRALEALRGRVLHELTGGLAGPAAELPHVAVLRGSCSLP